MLSEALGVIFIVVVLGPEVLVCGVIFIMVLSSFLSSA
jgi:hypothetical protein